MTVGLLASGKAYVDISGILDIDIRYMVGVGIRFNET